MSICCTVATSGSRYLSGLLVKDMALCFSKKACRTSSLLQTTMSPTRAPAQAGGATSECNDARFQVPFRQLCWQDNPLRQSSVEALPELTLYCGRKSCAIASFMLDLSTGSGIVHWL